MLARYAGTLVQVDATLMNQWHEGSEFALELQSGFLAFRTRMDSRGQIHPAAAVRKPVGIDRRLCASWRLVPETGTVSGFELLLNSPAGIRVLTTPPWWTLKRVLMLSQECLPRCFVPF